MTIETMGLGTPPCGVVFKSKMVYSSTLFTNYECLHLQVKMSLKILLYQKIFKWVLMKFGVNVIKCSGIIAA